MGLRSLQREVARFKALKLWAIAAGVAGLCTWDGTKCRDAEPNFPREIAGLQSQVAQASVVSSKARELAGAAIERSLLPLSRRV